MTKKPSAKRLFSIVSRVGRRRGVGVKGPNDALKRKAAKRIFECLERAFDVAERDIESERDWQFVTMWLAVSAFAGRDVGHPLHWTKRRMLRLISDVEDVKADRRARGLSATDQECCDHLLKLPPYNKLKGKRHAAGAFSANALRRRLSEARRMTKALAAVQAIQATVGT